MNYKILKKEKYSNITNIWSLVYILFEAMTLNYPFSFSLHEYSLMIYDYYIPNVIDLNYSDE
jgi:hypothetical protein